MSAAIIPNSVPQLIPASLDDLLAERWDCRNIALDAGQRSWVHRSQYESPTARPWEGRAGRSRCQIQADWWWRLDGIIARRGAE